MPSILRETLTALLALLFFLPAALPAQEHTVLVQTGSGMPEPLYKDWIEAYTRQEPSAMIRYMAIGTGRECPQPARWLWRFRRRRCAHPRSPAPRRGETNSGTARRSDRHRHHLRVARCEGRTQAHRSGARQYLPRENQNLERPRHRQIKSRHEFARSPDRSLAPHRRQRIQLHSFRFSLKGESGISCHRRPQRIAEVAGWRKLPALAGSGDQACAARRARSATRN